MAACIGTFVAWKTCLPVNLSHRSWSSRAPAESKLAEVFVRRPLEHPTYASRRLSRRFIHCRFPSFVPLSSRGERDNILDRDGYFTRRKPHLPPSSNRYVASGCRRQRGKAGELANVRTPNRYRDPYHWSSMAIFPSLPQSTCNLDGSGLCASPLPTCAATGPRDASSGRLFRREEDLVNTWRE